MDKRRGQPSDGIPSRIRIGVTGHRKLPDDERFISQIRIVLKEKIFNLIDDITKTPIHKSSHNSISFTLLTPLAEGADRLVAREVLKMPNATIDVVLPLAKEDYLEDFQSQASRIEFEELLGKARSLITLRERRLSEDHASGDIRDARLRAYEAVGRYVVDHCDVMVALWNNEESQKLGGTAGIVSYAAAQKRPLITISTADPYETRVEKGHGLNFLSLKSHYNVRRSN